MTSLPETLPVLRLADRVLLPSIKTKLTVGSDEVNALARQWKDNGFGGKYIVCVPIQFDGQDLSHFGCVANVIKVEQDLPEMAVLHVQGICRSRIKDLSCSDGRTMQATLVHFMDSEEQDNKEMSNHFRALCREYVARMNEIGIPKTALRHLNAAIDDFPVSDVINLFLCVTESSRQEKLWMLETVELEARLEASMRIINRHLQALRNSKEMQQTIEESLDKKRREFYLGQQFHALQTAASNNDTQCRMNRRSGTSQTETKSERIEILDEDDQELADLVEKLNSQSLPDYALVAIKRDVNRLRKLSPSAPESGVLRSYLELVADLPWNTRTDTVVNIAAARSQLDNDQFGLEQVKKRILEYLSVIKVKDDLSPPILCFVGPPGVGKSTLAKSVATALNRQFHRISLGSIRDEADIRGHRRTYVAAMPGLLINAMRKCGTKNPVILLDEIDKITVSSHLGDPAAALLEVLDPGQNATFMDHFLNIPFDLSQVIFIATANSLETISGPLQDRMEVVRIDGYTFEEKLAIARSHLLPKQLEAHGMAKSGLAIPDQVLLYIAQHYTLESGVRNLNRLIASICRYKCREYADLSESKTLETFKTVIDKDDVHQILGIPPLETENVDQVEVMPGLVNGLAYTQSGQGGLLPIEATLMPGRGRLRLTGSLGEVIKESAFIAVSWIKANAFALKLASSSKQELLHDVDLHIHIPSGAVPKDGPSAGITMAACIVSLLSGRPIARTTAMTGEITLRGQVRPVGGIKEKVLSAHRAGVTRIILPAANRRDVAQDIPVKIQGAIKFVYCKTMWDVIEAAFDQYDFQSVKCWSQL